MANPALYLSADAFRAKTQAPTLVTPLTDEEVEDLIIEAMIEIDAYAGDGWTPHDDAQEYVFPRLQDTDGEDNGTVPPTVALATRILADAILQQRSGGVLAHEVESETNLGHSYTKRRGAQAPPGYEHWPPRLFALLANYRSFGGQLALNDPYPVDWVYVR